MTSDNRTEPCENENGRRGATNTRDGLTHHSPLTRRRAVVSVSPDTQSETPHRAQDADETGKGICRTCAKPIWNEGGMVFHSSRDTGWSDRHPSGDSLVCFKAVNYRHVPLAGREAAIWDAATEAVHARYEAVAARCDREAESRRPFAEVQPDYRNTIIPYEAAAEWIRKVAEQ